MDLGGELSITHGPTGGHRQRLVTNREVYVQNSGYQELGSRPYISLKGQDGGTELVSGLIIQIAIAPCGEIPSCGISLVA
jgi:hypothetical protein